MAKQQVTTSKVREPMGHFSQAIAIEAKGKLVFISGMTARRPDGSIAGIGDVEAQTRQVCENLKSAVEATTSYRFGYELLMVNGLIVFVGLVLFSKKGEIWK